MNKKNKTLAEVVKDRDELYKRIENIYEQIGTLNEQQRIVNLIMRVEYLLDSTKSELLKLITKK